MTHLYSKDLHSNIGNSLLEFGKEPGLLVVRPGRSSWKYWFSIPDGMYAIVTEWGKELRYPKTQSKIWPAGFHWGAPWVKVSHLVTKQHIVFDSKAKNCLSSDNVPIEIDMCCVFRIRGDASRGEDPELVTKFVHEVTPQGLQRQLMDSLEEATRVLSRAVKHTEAYGLRGIKASDNLLAGLTSKLGSDDGSSVNSKNEYDEKEDDENAQTLRGEHDEKEARRASKATKKAQDICDNVKRELNEYYMAQGVEIMDVMIQDVKLPRDIVDQMANKTMIISENAFQKMNQQYEMMVLHFNEYVRTIQQKHQEEREKEVQQGEQTLKHEVVLLNDLKAEVSKVEKNINITKKNVINKIRAQSEYERSEIREGTNQVCADLRTNADREVAKIEAETLQFTNEKKAEAGLKVAECESEAQRIVAAAEGKSAPLLNVKNIFITEQRKLNVLRSLGQNKNLILSDTTDNDLNTLILCDDIIRTDEDGVIDRSQILSELVVLKKGSELLFGQST